MEIGDLMKVLWLDEYAKKYEPKFYFIDDLPKTLSKNRIYIIHTAQKANILNQKIIFGRLKTKGSILAYKTYFFQNNLNSTSIT